MSRTVYTFNEYHLGDQIIFLHLLRSLAQTHVSTPFVHFCHACYHSQLWDIVADLPNIILDSFESELWKLRKHDAINTWKNAEGHWENSKVRWDWSAHTLEHHQWTAKRMGFDSPFTCREHLLFDYPALEAQPIYDRVACLVGDTPPSSGQFSEWADHSKAPFSDLIFELRKRHFVHVASEMKNIGRTLAQIGSLSSRCAIQIMVANGPFWPTMNVHNHHNREKLKRIVLLDNGEQLNMPGILQMKTVAEVAEHAKKEGWI